MPPPQLADYQAAASSIYEPQKAAEQIALQADNTTTKNSLEAEKGQVNTDYQDAINTLTQNVKDQTAQISQLYAERLGGNFSGLQGNDMGEMFSKANQQQGIIAQTRLNKIGQITTGETNADISLGAGLAALTPKYQSLESKYALESYGSAVKDARTQANEDRNYNLAVAKLGVSSKNTADANAKKLQAEYKVTGKASGSTVDASGNTVAGSKSFNNGYEFTGPNGHPVNMAEYINGANLAGQDVVDLLTNGSSYDRSIAAKVAKANPQTDQQLVNLIKKYDTGKYYGF